MASRKGSGKLNHEFSKPSKVRGKGNRPVGSRGTTTSAGNLTVRPYDQKVLRESLQLDLQSLLECDNEKDVVADFEGTIYHLHKFVIKARCPAFYHLIEGPHETVYIKQQEDNMSQADFSKTVKNIYTATELKKVAIEDQFKQLYKTQDKQDDAVGDILENAEEEESPDQTKSSLAGCCALGDDLLALLNDHETADVTIKVDGKDILAHRQLLAIRSTYYKAMLQGMWSESDEMVVSLQNVSYNGVMFVLKYIYGGVSEVPSNADISEILQIADMYDLDLLKGVIGHYLKQQVCHNFHKPCSKCISGVVDIASLSWTFGPMDLYQECIGWISRYHSKLFVSKEILRLRTEVRQECINTVLGNLTPAKVIDSLKECETMWASLPDVKTVAPLREIVKGLEKSYFAYGIANLRAVVTTTSFLDMLKGVGWSYSLLERITLEIKTSLAVDNCCSTLDCLRKVQSSIALVENQAVRDAKESPFCKQAKESIEQTEKDCMTFIGRHIRAVQKTKGWKDLSTQTKKEIKEGAGFFDFAPSK